MWNVDRHVSIRWFHHDLYVQGMYIAREIYHLWEMFTIWIYDIWPALHLTHKTFIYSPKWPKTINDHIEIHGYIFVLLHLYKVWVFWAMLVSDEMQVSFTSTFITFISKGFRLRYLNAYLKWWQHPPTKFSHQFWRTHQIWLLITSIWSSVRKLVSAYEAYGTYGVYGGMRCMRRRRRTL